MAKWMDGFMDGWKEGGRGIELESERERGLDVFWVIAKSEQF